MRNRCFLEHVDGFVALTPPSHRRHHLPPWNVSKHFEPLSRTLNSSVARLGILYVRIGHELKTKRARWILLIKDASLNFQLSSTCPEFLLVHALDLHQIPAIETLNS